MARHFFQRLRANASGIQDLCSATLTGGSSLYNNQLCRYIIDQSNGTISISNEDYSVDKEIISATDSFTISFWVKVDEPYVNLDGTKEFYIASSDAEQCIKFYTDTDDALYMSIYDTYSEKDFVRWQILDTGGDDYITSGLLHEQMNHVMITRESVFLYFYFNGVYNDEIEVGDSAEFALCYFDSIGKLTASNNTKVSTCYVDDFVVFNEALYHKEYDIEVPTGYVDLYNNTIDGNTLCVAHFDDPNDPLKFVSSKISMFLNGGLSFLSSNASGIAVDSEHSNTDRYNTGDSAYSLKSLDSLTNFICFWNSTLGDEVTYDFKFKVKSNSTSVDIDPFDSGVINYVLNGNDETTTVLAIKPTNDSNELIVGAKSYNSGSSHTLVENTTINTSTSTRQWNHCAITIKKNEDETRIFNIFLNGKLVFSVDNLIDETTIPTIEFYFGLSNDDEMTCLIDELRISDVVRYDETGYTPTNFNYDLEYPIVLNGEENEWLDDSNIHTSVAGIEDSKRSVSREYDDIDSDTARNVSSDESEDFDTSRTVYKGFDTNITVPFMVYAITSENNDIEAEFDTNIVVVKDVTVDADTTRSVLMTFNELSDTERSVVKEVITNSDTSRSVSLDYILNSDTRRNTVVTSSEDFDTQLIIYPQETIRFDTVFEVKKNTSEDFDTNFKSTASTSEDYDTNRTINAGVTENGDTNFTVRKNITTAFDSLYKIVANTGEDYDTDLKVVKGVRINGDTKLTVYTITSTNFDTKLTILRGDEPAPIEEVKAKYIRIHVLAKSSNANFRGMTGDSHQYFWVSTELIKTMLERNFLVYELLAEPDSNGNTEIQLTLENYDKPSGGHYIDDKDLPSISVVPDIELEVANQHKQEMEEYLRQKGLEIKAQQDRLIEE